MDLVESIPRPPHSFRRFLAGRISTDAERFRISTTLSPLSRSPRTDILDPGAYVHVCVYARARVYIYRPRDEFTSEIALSVSFHGAIQASAPVAPRTTRSVYTPGI